MGHNKRHSTSSAKLVVNFANESARKSGTDRPPMSARPQHQATIFSMEVDNPASTRDGHPAPEIEKGRNIVIFGDSGVGKSSLINMLAGRKIAETSNGVLGCTFQSRQYTIPINGENVNLWDTAGLDEGTRGRVQPEVAEKNLAKLLRELRSASGVHLLVYCIRGPSVKKSLARNYVVFYSAICRKKVPIVAVVTGLENEPNSMDDWWAKGETELAKYKMRFDDHACVTTIDMEKAMGTIFKERSIHSQRLIQQLIIDNCRRSAARPPSDTNVFIKAALLDFRSMMRFGWENAQSLCHVTFYQSDVFLFHLGVFGDLQKITSQINGRSYVFQNAGDLSEHYVSPRISKGGADLLIFAGKMSDPSKEKFRAFYASCNGEVCPVLVVTDPHSVDAWKGHLESLAIGARVVSSTSPARAGQDQVPGDFRDQIDELCLVRGPARYRRSNLFRFFGRKSKEDVVDQMPAA